MNPENIKKIYVVSEFVDQKTNSTGYFWFKIIQSLSHELTNVHVLSIRESCKLAQKDNDAVNYINTGKSSWSIGKGFVAKLISNIFLSIQFAVKIIQVVKKNDIVFSGTNPSMLVLLIALIKPISGFKWILLVNDIFPENLVPARLVSENSFVYKITRRIFDSAYCRADKIIVIGRDMKHAVTKKTSGKVPIKYIPNWIDLQDIYPVQIKDSYQNHDEVSERKVVFQFFGNMSIVQGLDIILGAISEIACSNAKFKFIGGGSGVSLVEQYIKDNPQIDVELLPPVPFNKNITVLSECDVALVSLAHGMNGLAVPSKAYFSLAADKPILVIGEPDSELDLLIKDNPKIGWFCDSRYRSLIAKKIDEIAKLNFSELQGLPRSVIENQYSYKAASDKYVSLIKDVLNEE